MHHFLNKPDWLAEINEYLPKHNCRLVLDFDQHFVFVENDWLNGREPEDVAEAIATGTHTHLKP